MVYELNFVNFRDTIYQPATRVWNDVIDQQVRIF